MHSKKLATADQFKQPTVTRELIERYFADDALQCKLNELIGIATVEGQHGRWPIVTNPIHSDVTPLQQYLIEPLQQNLNLTVPGVLKLLRFVCSISRDLLDNCSEYIRSDNQAQARLELLDPHRLLVNLYDPLTHVGVRQPQRLLYACPGLVLGSCIPAITPDDTVRTSQFSESRKRTIVTDALTELCNLLPRNDLVSLLNRFPGVLLRPRDEIVELHSYLVEEMGLQSTELVRASRTRTHRHSLRHATGLRLVNCPAWCLPIERVRTRHTLAILTGCWPPSKVESARGGSPDEKLAKLLLCPYSKVPLWLGLSIPGNDKKRSTASHKSSIFLSSMDVEVFEFLLSKTSFKVERSDNQWKKHGLHDYILPDEELVPLEDEVV